MPPADPNPPIHCVLWHAPDAPPTPELTALLAQKGLTLETCNNPYAAAARLCRAQRSARVRHPQPANGQLAPHTNGHATPASPPLVLLLVEPSRLPQRDALARVLELHAPRTICWVYERTAGPTLRTEPLAGSAAAPPPPPTVTIPRREPTLTLAPAQSPGVASQVPINAANVLTDEELAMLLSDDDPPAPLTRTNSR